jgi:hypothetical protein
MAISANLSKTFRTSRQARCYGCIDSKEPCHDQSTSFSRATHWRRVGFVAADRKPPCHSDVGRARCASLDGVEKLLDGYVADKKMAGAIVAISYGDAAPAYLAAGTIALDSSTRIDEYSVCRIYSMTKPVTGIAAVLLVEDGTITALKGVTRAIRQRISARRMAKRWRFSGRISPRTSGVGTGLPCR